MKKVNAIAVAVASILAGYSVADDTTAVSTAAKPKAKLVQKKKISNKTIKTHAAQAPAKAQPKKLNAASAGTQQRADQVASSSSSASRVAIPSQVSAAPAVNAGTSTAQAPSQGKKTFADRIVLSADLSYYGGSVKEPFSGYQTDPDTGFDGGAVELDTHVMIGYKATDNLTFSLNPQWQTIPNSKSYNAETDSYDAQKGEGFTLLSPYVKLGVGKFVKTKSFKWNGDFRIYPGITDAQKLGGISASFRSGQNFMFTVTPKLTLAFYNIVRAYALNSDASDSATNLSLEAYPALEYALKDTLVLSVGYDLYAKHHQDDTWGSWNNGGTYLEPGIAWDVTPKINFNPYIDIYTGNRGAIVDTTRWGANVIFSIL